MTTTTTTPATFTVGRRQAVVVEVGRCGFGRCTHRVCVTVRFDGASTTENFEAAALVRATVADHATTSGSASAQFCADEADRLASDPVLALGWALRSLEHSVGVFHPTTRAVAALVAASTHPEAARVAARFG